jgi:DNA-binding transcriptional MerR regulator
MANTKETKRPWSWDEWYKTNKESHNKNRKNRYATDPEYRAQVLQNNRMSRDRQREKLREERLEEHSAIKVRVAARPWETIVKKINGVDTQLFTIGALAQATGRSIQSLTIWENEKLIPRTPYEDGKNHRYYTADQIVEIRNLLEAKGKLSSTRVQPGRPSKPIEIWIRKPGVRSPEKMQASSIGALAQVLNRRAATLQQLEKRKALPKTTLRKGGRRIYTDAMIEAVRTAFAKRAGMIRGSEWTRLYDEIMGEWKRLGMDGAVVVKAPRNDEDVNAKNDKAANAQVS